MATYKVLQDIEAEDKLIGPLTLRQCIYAAVAVIAGYLAFVAISQGAAFIAIFFLPFMGFGLFFAWPWGKQQSTEVWALAKVRFMLKPRKRIWDQSGVKDLVTVTVPKKLEDPRAHHMSEIEVRSRLRALADTIDSRGWAVKNVPINMYISPVMTPTSDRLVDNSNMPQQVAEYTTTTSDDMFDLANNPLAQQFEQKITASSSAHRQQIVQQMNHPEPTQPSLPAAADDTANYWYGAQASSAAPAGQAMPADTAAAMSAMQITPPNAQPGVPVAAIPTAEETALAQEIKRKQELLHSQDTSSYGHLRTIQPLSVQAEQAVAIQPPSPAQPAVPAMQPAQNPAPANPVPPVTQGPNPAILELANNNDLDIATIAREAHNRNPDASNEVVVTLH